MIEVKELRVNLFDKYFVSLFGDIINAKTGKVLKQQDNGKGYKKVTLTVNGEQIQKYLHRLVALIYIPNPNMYSQVNHKDGNKANNTVSNLEWCNNSINQIHAHDNELKPNGNKLYNAKFSNQQIEQIKFDRTNGMKYDGLCRKYQTSKGTISQIMNEKRYVRIFKTSTSP